LPLRGSGSLTARAQGFKFMNTSNLVGTYYIAEFVPVNTLSLNMCTRTPTDRIGIGYV